VDGKDFLDWQQDFGTASGATHDQGDANWDSAVNDLDYAIWEDQFGTTLSPLAALSVNVPEPSSILLAPMFLFLFRRHRK
jgi:hypothetical protein